MTINQQQLAALLDYERKLRPSRLEVMYEKRCNCPSDSPMTLVRVVRCPDPGVPVIGGQVFVWVSGGEILGPAAAGSADQIALNPDRMWLQLPRCRKCGHTWTVIARFTTDDQLTIECERVSVPERGIGTIVE